VRLLIRDGGATRPPIRPRTRALGIAFWAVAMSLSACASTQHNAEVPAASDPGRPTSAVATSGRVTLASVALAGRVAWRGIATAGTALGGLVTGGTAQARERWRVGADATRNVARAEARNVKSATRVR